MLFKLSTDKSVSEAAAAERPDVCAIVPELDGRGGHPVLLTPRGCERVLRAPEPPSHWTQAQAMYALAVCPETSPQQLRRMLPMYERLLPGQLDYRAWWAS